MTTKTPTPVPSPPQIVWRTFEVIRDTPNALLFTHELPSTQATQPRPRSDRLAAWARRRNDSQRSRAGVASSSPGRLRARKCWSSAAARYVTPPSPSKDFPSPAPPPRRIVSLDSPDSSSLSSLIRSQPDASSTASMPTPPSPSYAPRPASTQKSHTASPPAR